jgi:hypothetical protein
MVRNGTFIPRLTPQLIADYESLDLGQAPMSGPLELRGTFHLHNRGWSDIAIDEILSSCGCLAVTETKGMRSGKGPIIVRSGKSIPIDIEFHAAPIPRLQVQRLVVKSNDAARRELTLTAQVLVTGGVFASPSQLSIGRVRPGQRLRTTVHVADFTAPTKVQVSGAENSSGRIHASTSRGRIQSPDSLAGFGFVSSLVIDVSAPETIGNFSDVITILLSGSDQKTIVVPVIGTVVTPVEILPSPLVVVDKPGKRVTRTISCVCGAGEVTELKLNQRSSAGVSIHRSPKSELGAGAFDLTFALPREPGKQAREITVECSAGGRVFPASLKIISYEAVSQPVRGWANLSKSPENSSRESGKHGF